jgi:hypothetical protein
MGVAERRNKAIAPYHWRLDLMPKGSPARSPARAHSASFNFPNALI